MPAGMLEHAVTVSAVNRLGMRSSASLDSHYEMRLTCALIALTATRRHDVGMWFADIGRIGERIAWSVVAVWALVATVVLATRRTALGRLVPAEVRTPVLVGAGAMSLL